jgi:putative membrane protein
MKNTFKIFFSDIKSLSRHFFAVLVVIAIMIIPALYAWVNIYANSDPYGNTGNISVAVASDDLGYEGQNMGESVLEGLKDNKSINWVFTGSTDKAIKGVESGKYYAAIVIGENFSRNMYDLKSALTDNESTVTYYKNAKTNAIAVKITDTAAETVQNNVKVQYLKVLFQTVFTKGQELGEDIDEEQAVNAVIAQLTDLSKSLRHYSDSVGRFVSDSSSISYVLSGIGSSTANASAALSGSQATLNSAQAAVSNAQTSIDQLANGLDGKLAELEADLDAVTDALNKLASSEVINGSIELHNQMVDNAKNAAATLQTHLEALRAILPENSALSGTAYVANTLDALIERTKQMQNQLDLLYNDASFVEDAANITGACADTVSLMRSMITNQLKTGIDMMLTNLSSTLNMMSPLISSLGITLDDIAPVVESAGDTLSYVSSAMTRLQSLMTRVADACDDLLVKINEGTADERLQTLITVLNGNAEKYAEFLSSPVSVTEETIYPVASYGDAMTPFYSALAIWVGGVILTAILKVEAEPKGLRNVTEGQKYWGKFLLFFVLGQIQTAVIVLGDIYLLGCQCQEPVMFWVASAITSFAFTAVIYSLALAFGDIGKAIVIVIVVMQVAGSSGSYPIEILPDIFSKIYLFFPFPYAINAMREAICGMYQWDYWIYLGELMIFAVGGILIGLVLRKPFIKLNRFVEHEVEKSGVL